MIFHSLKAFYEWLPLEPPVHFSPCFCLASCSVINISGPSLTSDIQVNVPLEWGWDLVVVTGIFDNGDEIALSNLEYLTCLRRVRYYGHAMMSLIRPLNTLTFLLCACVWSV